MSECTTTRLAAKLSIDLDDLRAAAPTPRATREGWDAFDEGWSRFSNPHPLGSLAAAEWSWGWHEAQAGWQAQKELDAGADPEDYK